VWTCPGPQGEEVQLTLGENMSVKLAIYIAKLTASQWGVKLARSCFSPTGPSWPLLGQVGPINFRLLLRPFYLSIQPISSLEHVGINAGSFPRFFRQQQQHLIVAKLALLVANLVYLLPSWLHNIGQLGL
jgi:hypothetical protein